MDSRFAGKSERELNLVTFNPRLVFHLRAPSATGSSRYITRKLGISAARASATSFFIALSALQQRRKNERKMKKIDDELCTSAGFTETSARSTKRTVERDVE